MLLIDARREGTRGAKGTKVKLGRWGGDGGIRPAVSRRDGGVGEPRRRERVREVRRRGGSWEGAFVPDATNVSSPAKDTSLSSTLLKRLKLHSRRADRGGRRRLNEERRKNRRDEEERRAEKGASGNGERWRWWRAVETQLRMVMWRGPCREWRGWEINGWASSEKAHRRRKALSSSLESRKSKPMRTVTTRRLEILPQISPSVALHGLVRVRERNEEWGGGRCEEWGSPALLRVELERFVEGAVEEGDLGFMFCERGGGEGGQKKSTLRRRAENDAPMPTDSRVTESSWRMSSSCSRLMIRFMVCEQHRSQRRCWDRKGGGVRAV
jgi:hypothetical protein